MTAASNTPLSAAPIGVTNDTHRIAAVKATVSPTMSSAVHRALNIIEILERILFMVPASDLRSTRLVSHSWDRASYRCIWNYPDFSGHNMTTILPRLALHGHMVLELDFTNSPLYSENPSKDVDNLIDLCPNVVSLRVPYGCLTFDGVERLIRHYSRRKFDLAHRTVVKTEGGGTAMFPEPRTGDNEDGGDDDEKDNYQAFHSSQLTSLRLDLSQTSQQPSGMGLISEIGSRLKRLELKMNLREDRGRVRQAAPFLNYEELLEGCTGLEDLEIVPAPNFLARDSSAGAASNQQGQQLPPPAVAATPQQALLDSIRSLFLNGSHGRHNMVGRTTAETLKVFEKYASSLSHLTRLHLGCVWFSDQDLWTLSASCPGLLDLRLTNVFEDLHPTQQDAERLRETEWQRPQELMLQDERQNRLKKFLSLETVLKCWPRLKKLQLDGNKVCMFSSRHTTAPVVDAEGEMPSAPRGDDLVAAFEDAGLLPVGSYRLSSLCLYKAVWLTDSVLMAMVDLVAPTLQDLNVDRNMHLTNRSIRHVLMTCPGLRQLSASELDLSMGLFEDDDEDEDEQDHAAEGTDSRIERLEDPPRKPGRELLKPWACAKSLQNLDLSWRIIDGRAVRLPAWTEETKFLGWVTKSWEDTLPGYRHNPQSWPQNQQHERAYRAFLETRKGSMRLFRHRWQIESIYERLRVLENLQALQLEGWLVPWRASDITAFLGYSDKPESTNHLDPQLPPTGSDLEEMIHNIWHDKEESREVNGQNGDASEEESYPYLEADQLITEFASLSGNKGLNKLAAESYSLFEPSSVCAEVGIDPRAVAEWIPRSGLAKLRHLNIRTKNVAFFENRTGSNSPFATRLSAAGTPTVPMASTSTQSKDGSMDEQPYETSRDTTKRSPDKIKDYDRSQLYATLGAFMKACPELKRVIVKKESGPAFGWHCLYGFSNQLAISPAAKRAGMKQAVSSRRVLSLTLSLILLIAYPNRVQGATIAARGDNYFDEDPPSPPQDDENYKQCLSKCAEYVNKYWPQCQDRQNTPFDLCSVADMICAHRCKGKDTGKEGGLGDLMDAARKYFENIYRSME
ncbi:hypothetical protein EC968_000727 [Mortierella alpina]|nr:hypothetical protein EC968_000727 [Mortierella alpina]